MHCNKFQDYDNIFVEHLITFDGIGDGVAQFGIISNYKYLGCDTTFWFWGELEKNGALNVEIGVHYNRN